MSRRTGNNYSGARFLFSQKRTAAPTKQVGPSGLTLSGSSRKPMTLEADLAREAVIKASQGHYPDGSPHEDY